MNQQQRKDPRHHLQSRPRHKSRRFSQSRTARVMAEGYANQLTDAAKFFENGPAPTIRRK
jgi:hypothetical protein